LYMDRIYRDTTPLNLLLKSARTAQLVLNACSTVFILTNTVISKQVYTQVCASMSNTIRVSHVLGCHDVLFDLCPSIPHIVHVGGTRLRFLALASSKPLMCHLCCLGRPTFCGSSGGYQRRGLCRSLRVYM